MRGPSWTISTTAGMSSMKIKGVRTNTAKRSRLAGCCAHSPGNGQESQLIQQDVCGPVKELHPADERRGGQPFGRRRGTIPCVTTAGKRDTRLICPRAQGRRPPVGWGQGYRRGPPPQSNPERRNTLAKYNKSTKWAITPCRRPSPGTIRRWLSARCRRLRSPTASTKSGTTSSSTSKLTQVKNEKEINSLLGITVWHRPNSRIANPYSENEDYTVVVISADEGSDGPEEEYTVVPGMVQHVHLTGYPSNPLR